MKIKVQILTSAIKENKTSSAQDFTNNGNSITSIADMKDIGDFQNIYWDFGKGTCIVLTYFCEGRVVELLQKHKELELCRFAIIWKKIRVFGKKYFNFLFN